MINNLNNISLIFDQNLPLQIMTTYGTSPQIMAPLFNLFCIALACLALMYCIYLAFSPPRYGIHSPVFLPPTQPFSFTTSFVTDRVNVHRHGPERVGIHSHRIVPQIIEEPPIYSPSTSIGSSTHGHASTLWGHTSSSSIHQHGSTSTEARSRTSIHGHR